MIPSQWSKKKAKVEEPVVAEVEDAPVDEPAPVEEAPKPKKKSAKKTSK